MIKQKHDVFGKKALLGKASLLFFASAIQFKPNYILFS